jgi:hypothetical protein
MTKLIIILLVSITGLGAATWLLGVWPFAGADIPPIGQEVVVESEQAAKVEDALALMRTAFDRFAGVTDYECTYLRDELIDGTFHENHLHLRIRHEPFAVRMEWLAPKAKKGRVTTYLAGQHKDQMVVKEPVVRGLPPITVHLAPEESKKRKESRHVITEAGLRNAMARCLTRWEEDRSLGMTKVTLEDAELIVALPDHEVLRACRRATLLRPADSGARSSFDHYRVQVYFDKETNLPIRFETFDWPEAGHEDGRLIERYTYLDVRTNRGFKDADFE